MFSINIEKKDMYSRTSKQYIRLKRQTEKIPRSDGQEVCNLLFKPIQDQADSSCESSPQIVTKIQFKKTQFSKIQVAENTINQYLTPRGHCDQNLNILNRKTSHSVIAQYVMDKNKKLKSSVREEQKLPLIKQPSLNEFNQYFLAQKRSIDVGRLSQQLMQSKSQDNGDKQIQLNQKQNQFINKQINMLIQQKSDPQINQNIRIRTLPNDINASKTKTSLLRKLRPYLK
ncbi:unnamed protein product (macronuclear) [Paramecium tetraurelia]|uniref:Uncharacterized protein n=1 Tax=Paramecium tetraurelia TaxID=5888 RepID=A0D3I4_PARTE|nr:uncharacterized protein GSPATT00013089001 [Paramecium tetraurelia]CAK77601.1 unnamed protein product [Paramecium tetraurelia]|eukprot:XP_001444998.1 hypothetical protein (macronuclear) [Paramecium tetraurelia strain d4-2]